MGRILSLTVGLAITVGFFFVQATAIAKDTQEYKTNPLAVKFGTLADIRDIKLSPDGTKISMIKWFDQDIPAAVVFDLQTGKGRIVASSKKGDFSVTWCDWANNERLLCGYRAIATDFDIRGYFPTTRLVAVSADGSKMKVLLEAKLLYEFSQFQDRIVDWLPDDPKNVLVEVPVTNGSGVSKLNIYSGHTKADERLHQASREWIADGRGHVRLYYEVTPIKRVWHVRNTKDSSWRILHEARMVDLDDSFSPIGFGEGENDLYFLQDSNGLNALWEQDLATGEEPHIVFSADSVDVSHLLVLGKFRRLVAVGYVTDRPRLHFFDKTIANIHASVHALFPDKGVDIVDESWDRRYYLVSVSNDRDPGTVYRLDASNHQLAKLLPVFSKLVGTEMAPVGPITFKARDGVEVPGYLTLPIDHTAGQLPLVVLPHGGPQSRDIGDFDPIVQFLAASGYAVLQVNFRGSGGYGEDWAGAGGFQNWRQAIEDITDGAKSLITDGTADAQRMCIVGWSYGGYASLMSVIEEPTLYKCAVSIAGVTDPKSFVRDFADFLNHRAVNAFVGHDDEVLDNGSPQRRAEEVKVPVLLFHGEKDLNVSVDQSKEMAEKLDRAKVPYQYIEYEDVEHDILRNRYRIDMLSRIGEFLEKNIGAGQAHASK